MSEPPFDNGSTYYEVTIAFSNDYPRVGDPDEEGNPVHWDWAGLISEPDARCIATIEGPNEEWIDEPLTVAEQLEVAMSQLAVSHAHADRMKAERDWYAGRLSSITGEDYSPEAGTVWTLPEEVLADEQR